MRDHVKVSEIIYGKWGVNVMLLDCRCTICQEVNQIVVDIAAWNRWNQGELIQVAMPELDADQREMLITGMCPKCWEDTFSEDEKFDNEDEYLGGDEDDQAFVDYMSTYNYYVYPNSYEDFDPDEYLG